MMHPEVMAWLEESQATLHRLEFKHEVGSCSVPVRQHRHEYRALSLAIAALAELESPALALVMDALEAAMNAEQTYDWRIGGYHGE